MGTTLDTSDMIFVHNVFRKFFDTAPRLLGTSHVEHQPGIARYITTVLRLLNSHHEAEDKTVWPLLHKRIKAEDEKIFLAEDQHHELETHLEECFARLSQWHEDATQAPQLQAAIQKLADSAREHMDYEEAVILPLCHEHITPEEWRALPAHTLQGLTGETLMMTLGLVRDSFDESRRAGLDANTPPPVAALWESEGRALYQETIKIIQSL